MKHTSFSASVKQELSRIQSDDPDVSLAEIAGLLGFSGALSGQDIVMNSEAESVIQKAEKLLTDLFRVTPDISFSGKTYRLFVPGGEESWKIKEGAADCPVSSRARYRRAYLRGAFLAGGSILDPGKRYHAEFLSDDTESAKNLRAILKSEGISSRLLRRTRSKSGRVTNVLYLKDGNQIVDLLRLMGASSALLTLESVRVEKEVKNDINRRVNCEAANIFKTVTASARQIQDIEFLEEAGLFEELPGELRDMARVRREHPDAPLGELGRFLEKPISKSGVNHRLNKISEIAQKERMRKG